MLDEEGPTQAALRFRRLLDKGVSIENLATGSKWRYNDDGVKQLLSFGSFEDQFNVGVYGVTEVGQSYFMSVFLQRSLPKKFLLRVCSSLRPYGRTPFYRRFCIEVSIDFLIQEGTILMPNCVKRRT